MPTTTPWQRALRVGRIFRGYVACVVVAAVVATALSFGWDGEALGMMLFGAFGASLLPFVVCVLIAEIFSIRSPFYYAAGSLFPIAEFWLPRWWTYGVNPNDTWFVASLSAGAISGGLTYWLIAGRFAGRDKAPTEVSLSES